MNTRAFFESHPVFRFEEFAQFMRERGVDRPASWRQQLAYHHRKGRLIHIRRFLYAVKPVPEGQPIDPYLVAGKATQDAILAYHTALELHGIAYTTFSELNYLIRGSALPFSWQGQVFRAAPFPKPLVQQKMTERETEITERQGLKIRLTTLERTVVDVLDRPDLSGGWEEIWRSLDNVTHLDLDRLTEYVLLLKNSTAVSKVGYFLEQRPAYLCPDERIIKKLVQHIPAQPHYMNRNRQRDGKFIKKWNLIVPAEIVERKWEEPDAENI